MQRPKITPSMGVSLAALVLATSGGAYAAAGGSTATAKRHKRRAAAPLSRGQVIRLIDQRLRHVHATPGVPGPAGASGAAGATGPTGATGARGPQGPGATSFSATLASGSSNVTLQTLANGVVIQGDCGANGAGLELTAAGASRLDVSGTVTGNAAVQPLDVSDGTVSVGLYPNVDYDVISRVHSPAGSFDRIDVHGAAGTPCTFWGVVTPSG